jgi:glycosyltransferase involved in cell wall biosynthesis
MKVLVSVLIATRNEERNLPRCLEALEWVDEIVIVDSQSTDRTVEIAESHGAKVVQFRYQGGWPKKRQWALETFPLKNEWILVLDADEIMTPELREEIASAIERPTINGYYLRFQIHFLGKQLRYGDTELWKLVLFRRAKGRYECRTDQQDASMGDVEIHEHVIVDGPTARLKHPVRHENFNSLSRYIEKHNEYSNWEARVLYNLKHGIQPQDSVQLEAKWFGGTQAQKRRWLKTRFFQIPGFSVLTFLYHYVLRLGFLDGIPGLIYCSFKGVQRFHTKAKIYEMELAREPQISYEAED